MTGMYMSTTLSASKSLDPVASIVRFSGRLFLVATLTLLVVTSRVALSQVNVLTKHNDTARTGQNLNETVLTPANVGGGNFGKLFSQSVISGVYVQPLYVSQVTIPGQGVHNVVYVATYDDYVYAFDADSNGGANANPLWKVSLTTNTSTTYNFLYGVIGTPLIDLSSKTMYLVSADIKGSTDLFRLHALDITTGAEKFGGPVQVQASVPGTGAGSSGGVLAFDAEYEFQRTGMLELNGIIYFAFGSNADNGPWHGWIFSYNPTTLQQIDALCLTPNGSGGGIWMGAAGLAGEVYNPAKPYGRMFVATGNGTFTASQPFNSTMNFAMSVLDIDLTNGQMTVEDEFTPYNWKALNSQDGDLGSGGPVLLPTQTLASGLTLNPLVEVGKSGLIYMLDRDNTADGSNSQSTEYSPAGLGGFNATADQTVQEVQTPESGSQEWGAGVWGSEAYWNNNIYVAGTNPGASNSITAYSFVNGVLSTTPTSQSAETYAYPGPTPSISANGTTNGIAWVLHGPASGQTAVLEAYDATNLGNLLYSSNTNLSRDNPGNYDRFSAPTIVNGKVYVGAGSELNVYGMLVAPTTATPVISPAGGSFASSDTVAISDATSGAQIYYTTDGSTPTVASNLYTGTITVTATETITAIASANGYLQSATTAATFTATSSTVNPVLSLAAGTYTGTQSLTITDATSGATIYYTFDGSTPTSASTVYSGPINVPVSETITAIATAPGLSASSAVSDAYTIIPPYAFNFSTGFADSQSPPQVQFNGTTDLDDYRLQLTNGGFSQAGSAFYVTPVNIQSFTTDFTFQLSNAMGDGITFTIQGNAPTALGKNASGLGYAGIANSVAIKFDIYNDAGQGSDSTGLYINGVAPTLPSIDLTKTGINLRSGDFMNVHLTYDGKILDMTITDAITLATWSTAFTVNIPAHVGGSTAYVGFTGSTGGTATSSQKVTYWTYLPGAPTLPNYPAGFDNRGLNSRGSLALSGTSELMTSGNEPQSSSLFFSTPVNIDAFTSTFDFTIAAGTSSTLADGLTFVVQNAAPNAMGSGGAGLGYANMPKSVAVKFDTYNNAGEGADSTGVYINGAMPTVPSIDLTSSGVQLGSGDQIHAVVSYNGTTLTWTLTDLTSPTQPTVTNSTTINIPDTVGGNIAYVGFTAASADGTANQALLDWTVTNP